jgi:hypothetical protein
MEFGELNEVAQHKEFKVFNDAELVVGIAVPGDFAELVRTLVARMMTGEFINPMR